MPVHLFGNPADMVRISEIASKHGLAIIEDAAQAHGAAIDGKRAGSWGTACFSFYPTKNITTGEGGMITTGDDCIADRARWLARSHGMRVRYYHESLGYNFRMTNIHAAIGLAQLPKLEGFNEKRIANATYLSEHLPQDKVSVPQVRPGTRHVFHQYTVRVLPPLDRDNVRERLPRWGWVLRSTTPYPCNANSYTSTWATATRAFLSERAAREVLSLPVHPGLTQAELDIIIEAVNSI